MGTDVYSAEDAPASSTLFGSLYSIAISVSLSSLLHLYFSSYFHRLARITHSLSRHIFSPTLALCLPGLSNSRSIFFAVWCPDLAPRSSLHDAVQLKPPSWWATAFYFYFYFYYYFYLSFVFFVLLFLDPTPPASDGTDKHPPCTQPTLRIASPSTIARDTYHSRAQHAVVSHLHVCRYLIMLLAICTLLPALSLCTLFITSRSTKSN